MNAKPSQLQVEYLLFDLQLTHSTVTHKSHFYDAGRFHLQLQQNLIKMSWQTQNISILQKIGKKPRNNSLPTFYIQKFSTTLAVIFMLYKQKGRYIQAVEHKVNIFPTYNKISHVFRCLHALLYADLQLNCHHRKLK